MDKYNSLGLRLQRVFGFAMNSAGTAVGNQQVVFLPVDLLEIIHGPGADSAACMEAAYGLHIVVVTDNAQLFMAAGVAGGEGRANGGNAVDRDVRQNCQAKIVDGNTGCHLYQQKVLRDAGYGPAQPTGKFFHGHGINFPCRDDFHSVGHHHQWKHGAVIIMQVGQEHR